MKTLLLIIRRLFPASARARMRIFLFDWLDLTWELPSSVLIRIGSYGDWIIFSEVFVSGEYDEAIAMALDARSGNVPVQIVDLGANAGFFTLRAADRVRTLAPQRSFSITAVEADETMAARFQSRVFDENKLAEHVTFVRGLVGHRAGEALFYQDSVVRQGRGRATRLRYLDLSPILDEVTHIDLLKCDIEGSEEQFLETYSDVMARVRVAVFEFHRAWCDVDRCKTLLQDYGLVNNRTIREHDTYSIFMAWR